jgi:formate hydrogenlyase subunit 3/multisubunit Na+/H+ antiporter MnhD subunit
LVVTLATPLVMLVIYLSVNLRDAGRIFLPFAPLPALATALLAPDGASVKLPDAFLGLTFVLDRPGALLLGTAALLWCAAGVFSAAYPRANMDGRCFTVWWLATLTGSLGVFVAADLPGFYLFFTLVSLSAYWLVVDDGTRSAKRVGAVYVSFALLGEAFLLLAFVMMAAAAPDGDFLIRDAVAVIGASPMRDVIVPLLILGFGVKIGLVPLHVWMPLTYTAAPVPVAAVLSGAAVKAGVIGLIKFLPFGMPLPGWGETLAIIGMFSAFYGVAIGITQSNAKTVLAYSSISQMGTIAAVLGVGLASGDTTVPLLTAFYALHHTLVKGGLFLAISVASRTKSPGVWSVLVPAAVIALGLGGLPFTGGALAKIAIKTSMGDGLIGMLAMIAAAGSTLLMLHFIDRLRAMAGGDESVKAPIGLLVPWLAIAFAAIALPWALFPSVTQLSWTDTITPKVFWESLWPVMVGGLLAVMLRRWKNKLPRIPAGDVIVAKGPVVSLGQNISVCMERIDWNLRQWPVAGATLLLVTIATAGAMYIGR